MFQSRERRLNLFRFSIVADATRLLRLIFRGLKPTAKLSTSRCDVGESFRILSGGDLITKRTNFCGKLSAPNRAPRPKFCRTSLRVKIFRMNGHEIRQKFIEYFAGRGHKIVHSSPLLPANDPTLLFTNAGMNQFKDVFLGSEKRDYKRAVSSQKCIRAGGKHNDLDEVGKTARHHTFFEMLGNFSFGDYFKEDAIRFAWDFLVNELKLDKSRLWFSIFEGDAEVGADEEARALWIKNGAPPERVLAFGRKDNFWQMGDTGPCGPCSEIHYYMGDEPANPEKNRADLVNAADGDTTMEIWNLVFMQFERNEISKGVFKLTPLPAPSVDTGMGLERVTAVMEGQTTNYETSLIKPIVEFVATMARE